MIVSTDCLVEMVHNFDKVEGNYLVLFKGYLNADFTCDIGFTFVRTKPGRDQRTGRGRDGRDILVPLINCVIVN